MIMPLESLINFSGNAYELAAAVSMRAYQLAVLRTPEVEKNNGKVVSMATQEILDKTIGYKLIAVDAVILQDDRWGKRLLDAVFGAGASTWVPRLRDAWQTDFFSAEIISADSMQAYRGMDIGTAKPSKDLLSRLPHHLIDIKNPDEQYTAGEFVTRADALSSELSGRDVLPIISGGTGFYLMNYICGLPASPPSSPEIRAQVAADLKRLGPAALRAELEEADPATASRIHEHDLYRLTRAVEILRTSGEAPSRFAPSKMVRPVNAFHFGPSRPARYCTSFMPIEA